MMTGPAESVYKLFDTLMVFLKAFFKQVRNYIMKKQLMTKNMKYFPNWNNCIYSSCWSKRNHNICFG